MPSRSHLSSASHDGGQAPSRPSTATTTRPMRPTLPVPELSRIGAVRSSTTSGPPKPSVSSSPAATSWPSEAPGPITASPRPSRTRALRSGTRCNGCTHRASPNLGGWNSILGSANAPLKAPHLRVVTRTQAIRQMRTATPARLVLRLHMAEVFRLPVLRVGSVEDKVLRAVISSIMVSMMDNLSRPKPTP